MTSGDVSPEDSVRFDAWAEDGANRQAYDALDSMLPYVDQAARAVALEPEVERPLPGVRVAALAATLVLALTGVWFLLGDRAQTFQTDVAETRTIDLADGSVVHLNARTWISASISRTSRAVELEGEALFEVVADTRPFVVQAGGKIIRVVGTTFNARTDVDGAVVTVVEGLVRIDGVHELGAGQQLRYGPDEVGEITTVDPEQAIAWRDGLLIYEREPLAEVLRDLNRHLSGRVLRATAETEHLPVTGVFRLDDIGGSLEALEAALPVRRIRRGETIVFVPEGLAR